MTLCVPIDQFADAVRRVLGQDDAFVTASSTGSVASSYSVVKGVRVLANSPEPPDALCQILREARLKVQTGRWIAPEEASPDEDHIATYVAAIAYSTGHPQPGVWVDAFPAPPSQTQAIRSMFDEFKETGEIDEHLAFEEFVRQANPTVVVVSPTELRSYAEAKED